MFKNTIIVFLAIMAMPAMAAAGHTGGISQNLGGQMLTVSADVGYTTRDFEYSGNKEEISSRSFAIKTTYGLNDNIDLFVNLGFADIQDINPGTGDYTGALGTLLGGGFKFLAFGSREEISISVNAGIDTFESSDSGKSAVYFGYQIAAIISNKSGNFTPFGGIKVSDAEIDFGGAVRYEANKHLGLFAGVDYFVNPNTFFTGEVHMFDENTIYVGVGYHF